MANLLQSIGRKVSGIELIHCIRQPGRLRISKRACAYRYVLSWEKKYKFPDDEFGMAFKAGLEICRTCPIGSECSRMLEANEIRHLKQKPAFLRRRRSNLTNKNLYDYQYIIHNSWKKEVYHDKLFL